MKNNRRVFWSALFVAVLLVAAMPVGAALPSTPTQIKDPVKVAQKLYDAWHVRSRRAALRVAEKRAVNKLFSTRWHVMHFEGCKNRDEGGYECIYRDKKHDLSLAMILDGGVSAGGYNVVSLSFSSES